MAFYTSSIKTHYVEPSVFYDKNRAEFRLDTDLVYLSNWRLLNLGHDAGDINYNINTGVMRFVKTIELLDASRVLCRIDNVADVYSFKRINNTNEYNSSMSVLDRTGLGFDYTSVDITNDGTKLIITTTPIYGATQDADSYVDLNDILPFLKASQIVPTTVFKDLRLVFTFTSQGVAQWQGATRPLLAVDEMQNTQVVSELMKSYKGFSWLELEQDRFVVPAVLQDTLVDGEVRVQSVRNQLKGFDNKMVRRCFVQKKGSIASTSYGLNGSKGMYRESLQVRKNGANIFPSALDSPALIQNEVLQVWGEMNKTIMSINNPALESDIQPDDDYMAFDLSGARTVELQIEYKRSVCKDDATNPNAERTGQPLQVNVYGEVMKVLAVQDGSYRLMYV